MSLGAKRQHRMLELIEKLEVLQTTTVVPIRILHLRRSKSASLQDFAALVEMDQSLCTKVLSLANSAWFKPPQPVTRLSTAVSMIGLNNLLPLLFGVSLAGVFNKLGLPPSENRELWRSALLKAIAAREVVNSKNGEYADEAFVCGLLQDVALPVMYAADPASWPRMKAGLGSDNAERAVVEQRIYAADHAVLGQRLVRRMGLPMLYVAATGAHHDTERLRKIVKDQPLCEALEFAAALPHRMSEWHRMRSDRLRALAAGAPEDGDGQQALVQLLQRIQEKHREIEALLGESDSSSLAFRLFLEEVCGEVAHTIEMTIGESATTITRLKARESELLGRMKGLEQQARESDYDALTRILNRRGFVAGMQRITAVAREYQFGCGVGYLDLDNFKKANDTHGHAVGDAVLKAVAAMLREAVGERGAVGRIGGDEFVFLVVATDQPSGVAVAEQISQRLQTLEVPVEGHEPVKVGGSVGLMWAGVPADQPVEELLQQADKLMYQAKRQGKAQLVVAELNEVLDSAEPVATGQAA